MALTLPTNVVAGNTGHINAHNTLHQLSNGFILSTTAFYIPATSVSDSTSGHLMWASARGANSGVAPLDGGGLLPAANLPLQAIRKDVINDVGFGITFRGWANTNPTALLVFVGSRGSATPSPILSGDRYAKFFFQGQYDTTLGNTTTGAIMWVVATENFAGSGGTATNAGSKIEFYTVPNGTTAPVLALTLDQNAAATFGGAITTPVLTVGFIATIADGATLTMGVASNIVLSATTGTKIGTGTTQKLGLWNATPVVQYATTGTSTGFTAGGGTAATSLSTFTGNTGSAAYTTGDVVRALKLAGIMAA